MYEASNVILLNPPIMLTTFTSDLKADAAPLSHYWEHTIGSGHASLALRADWQQQLTRCSRELGFKHVRFHGILSDDVGTLMCEMEKLVYSFFNADQICDFLLSIGMKPFMELSFMPTTLSSGPQIVFHYKGNITPPKDYNAWGTLIKTFVQHLADRYGLDCIRKWFFEIWNEPNLAAFWTGTQQEYFQLYQHAAFAIKEVDAQLQVGGPATAGNAWITEFRDFCQQQKVPYDFISTHHYPTDAFGQPGDDTIAQLAASHRSVLREQTTATRAKAGDTPVYYTEWSTSSNPFDALHDLPYAAAFITKTIMEGRGIVQGYSYWTFSDIFEENFFSSIPFHGGFGLMNMYGIPKPAYRAYELMHRLGNEMVASIGTHPTVDVWVVKSDCRVHVLITNGALPRHDIQTAEVKIELQNIGTIIQCYAERIDEDHANARKAWEAMGKPGSLNAQQVKVLEEASSLQKETLLYELTETSVSFQLNMPVQGTALISFDIA